jgi:hypothetical protein
MLWGGASAVNQRIRTFLTARPLILLLLAAAPFVPSAIQFLRLGVPDVLAFGDYATLELRTLNASHGLQLLGPYSHFHWSHPGPAFFYLALPIYELFNEHSTALNLFVLICNLAVTVALVLTARKLRGDAFALATALLLGMYETVATRFTLSDDWNPMVPVLPLALLSFLSVRLALGAVQILPWFLFVASAMVQTHVGYAPPVFFLLGVAAIFGSRAFITRRLWQTSRRTVLTSALAATLVLMVSWALPVYQNFSVHPGNISTLWAFFTASNPTAHPLPEAAEAVATQLSIFPLALAGVFFPGARSANLFSREVLALVQLVALATGSGVAFRRRDQSAGVLCLVAVGLILVGFLSARAIRGEIQDYLVTWITVLSMVAHAAIVAWLLPPVIGAACERRLRIALIVIAVPLFGLGIWRVGDRQVFPAPDADLEKVATEVEAYVRASHIDRPMLQCAGSVWINMTGIALRLYKHRVPFVVSDRLLGTVGPQFESTSAPRFELAIVDKPAAKHPNDRRQRELIASSGKVFVYLVRR